jgi:hypothetical protein
LACAGAVVRVVVQAGIGVAVDADRRILRNIKAGECRALGRTAAGGGIVGSNILEHSDEEEEGLIHGGTPDEGDGDDGVGGVGVGVESPFEQWGFVHTGGDSSTGCGVGAFVEEIAVDFHLDIVNSAGHHSSS